MSTLRILVPTHVMPNVKSVVTLFFDNLLPVLRTKTKVHMIWLVYQPEKLHLSSQQNSDTTILDIHDYENALEILQKVKPDIIHANATWSFIDHALSSAAKLLNIPVVSLFFSDWVFSERVSTLTRLKLLTKRFVESSIPTDTMLDKKQIMRRGRFFIYKYLFLLKTQKVTKINRLRSFFMLSRFIIFDKMDSRFSNTLHFLENEGQLKPLLDLGFKRSTLVITGNPIYDAAFQKSNQKKTQTKKNDFIRVLLAPSTQYEHGFWTREQRDKTVKEILTQIHKNKEQMSAVVKIHPSTSRLSEYQLIINSIDPSIQLYQKGDIQQFIEDTDLEISFQSSTAELYALIAKKPIIICNFFNEKKSIFVEKGLAIECNEPNDLIPLIHESLQSNSEYEQNRENFIKEYLYKGDGRASERISDELMAILEKRKSL